MTRQVILDTETTGLLHEEGHRVIEIGCIEMINRQLTGKYFHQYLNPDRDVDPGAEAIHGISTASLRDKPRFADIAEEWIEFIRGAELIIHNAPFDVGFLNSELLRWRRPVITEYCSIVDSLAIARRKHPGQHNSLDALCKRYRVNNTKRQWHGALLDAELLAQVYLLMTGGQVELFAANTAGENFTEKTSSIQIKRLSGQRTPLAVIQANAQELHAHQDFLKVLKTENDW
jgi:DNA polymerase-3 subunit epsilon